MSSVGVDDHYTGGCAPAAQLQEDDLTLRQVSTRLEGEVRILNKGIEDRGVLHQAMMHWLISTSTILDWS